MSKMQAFVRTEYVETCWSYDGRTPTEVKGVKRRNIPEDELVMDIGTRVKVTDGKAGRIDELMVEPISGSITHLMLRKGPMWAPRAVMIPVAEVERMGEKAVYLRTNRAGIEALPAVPATKRSPRFLFR
jgi:hypothetical protein